MVLTMSRKRDYIQLSERLAAALACLLPNDKRDELRVKKVPAEDVIKLFHNDHIVPHADGGSNAWHNLDPLLTAVHQEKTAKVDIPRIAKGKRIRRKEAIHRAALNSCGECDNAFGLCVYDQKKVCPETQKSRPRRGPKIPSRPFSRGKTPGRQRPPLTKTVPRRLPPG